MVGAMSETTTDRAAWLETLTPELRAWVSQYEALAQEPAPEPRPQPEPVAVRQGWHRLKSWQKQWLLLTIATTAWFWHDGFLGGLGRCYDVRFPGGDCGTLWGGVIFGILMMPLSAGAVLFFVYLLVGSIAGVVSGRSNDHWGNYPGPGA